MAPRRSRPGPVRRGPGWLPALLVVGAVLMAVLPVSRSAVESVYSQGVYPVLRQLVTAATNRVPLVLFDWLLFGGAAAILGWCAWRLWRRERQGRLRVLGAVAARLAVVAAALYLVFLATWGLNYRRETLAVTLGYAEDRVTPAVLEELTASGVTRLNRLFEAIETRSWPQLEELPAELGPAFERVQRELGASRPAPAVVPRRSLLTPYFRRAGIDGMTDPFSLQVLVNDTVLPFERPFVTAHEWAHVAGYAHEAEANFVAWLTCLEGDERMQYSGWLNLVARLLGAVPESSREALGARLGAGPRADYAAIRARTSRVVPVIQRNARRLNDGYLRANRVAGGVRSYGEVLQLAVGTELGRRRWPARDAGELPGAE